MCYAYHCAVARTVPSPSFPAFSLPPTFTSRSPTRLGIWTASASSPWLGRCYGSALVISACMSLINRHHLGTALVLTLSQKKKMCVYECVPRKRTSEFPEILKTWKYLTKTNNNYYAENKIWISGNIEKLTILFLIFPEIHTYIYIYIHTCFSAEYIFMFVWLSNLFIFSIFPEIQISLVMVNIEKMKKLNK